MAESSWARQSSCFQTEIAKISIAGTMPLDIRVDLSNEKAFADLRAEIEIVLKTANLFGDICQESVQKIVQRCKYIGINLELKVIHIAVVYVCVRENSGTDEIVPVFRVYENTSPTCYIIDHSANFYENLKSYLKALEFRNTSFMIPKNARYELVDEECKVHLKFGLNFKKSNVGISKLGENILKSIETIKSDQDLAVANLENVLGLTEDQKKIFDAFRQGYHDIIQPGAARNIYGDRKFIQEISSIREVDKFFKNFTMTEDEKFNINGQLTIHPRVFLQMPEESRIIILEKTELLKNEKISLGEIEREFTKNHWTRRLVLDPKIVHLKEELSKQFGVEKLEDVNMGAGRRILADLKQYEIQKLYNLMKYWRDKLRDIYFNLSKDFATEIRVANSTEFCRAAEYIVAEVQRRAKDQRRFEEQNRSFKDILEDVTAEFRKDQFNDIKTCFQDLLKRCGEANASVGTPSFSNPFAAAIHYHKHWNGIKQNSNKHPKDYETYFKIAHETTRLPFSEVKWTQDGSSLCCTYITEKYLAHKYISLVGQKTETIASLRQNFSHRKVLPEVYYYHLEYYQSYDNYADYE